MAAGNYVIRGGVEGRERLRLLAEALAPATRSLLAEAGVRPGSVCLDVGCGGGDVTRELARAAGPSGRVLGVDLDEVKLGIARRECAEAGLGNVAFAACDVTAWESSDVFDVIYARFLLTHLADPGRLLRSLRPRLRPGGRIIVEDIDFRGHFAEPACPAFDRYVELYTKSVENRGADANIGPRLPGLLREAGFEDVRMRLTQPGGLDVRVKLMAAMTFESISETILRDGLIGEDELRRAIEELYAFCGDPDTVVAGPRVIQAWGRAAA